MPINLADKGVKYTIQRIAGKDEVRHHLASLGFVPGEEVIVVSEVNGNYVIALKDTRIGVGRELAKMIIVA